MSDDLVRNEVNAVRALKKAVSRYAEQIRAAAAQARREMAAADRKAEEGVERRRSQLNRAEQELRRAQAALAQCRENCGGLQQEVRVAFSRHAVAKHELDRARKAAHLTASAQSELLKMLQTVESAVGEQSSVASSALASLDAKLASLPHVDVGHAVHNLAVGTAVGVEIFGASMNLGRVAANAATVFGVELPVRDQSVSEMVEHQNEQAADYVIHKSQEVEKHLDSGDGTETIA